jgi:hypothetical protein
MNKPILTRNINSVLQDFASTAFIPLQECDFTLLSYIVYAKYPQESSFARLEADKYELYKKDPKALLTDGVSLYQNYRIEILSHRHYENIELDYEVEFDDYKISPLLLLRPSSKIPYREYKPAELLKILFKECNKIKARHNILIDIYQDSMIKQLKSFVKLLYSDQFTKSVRIKLFDGMPPLKAVSSETLLHFQKSDKKLDEVHNGDILLEYKKPVYGSSGFNSLGNRLSSKNMAIEEFDYKVDAETIASIDAGDRIILKAKRDGYIKLDGKNISVSNVVEVEKIKRVETKLTDDEDNKIEIVVSESDVTEDSVGEGVELVSERIHIRGHVGKNSVLKASHIIIDGATHKSSKVFAKYAIINRHKGLLKCHKAEINLLEGGTVHASNAQIQSAIGGTVYAINATLNHIKNNLTVFASNSITIKLITGEDNKFIIDYQKIPIIMSKMKFIQSDLDELNFQLEEAQKKDAPTKEIEQQIELLKKQKQEIVNSPLQAFIDIGKAIEGLNYIRFRLPNNKEIEHKTFNAKFEKYYFTIDKENDTVTLHPLGTVINL